MDFAASAVNNARPLIPGRNEALRRPRSGRRNRRKKAQPAELQQLKIDKLGRRGDGIAGIDGRPIYVPFALPGEQVEAEVRGERGVLTSILSPAENRVVPPCPHFGTCGGCAVQHLADGDVGVWKHGLVAAALARSNIDVTVDDMVIAHGEGRRRATLHVERHHGAHRIGFMEARRHHLHPIDHCPILTPALENVVELSADLAGAVAAWNGTLHLQWTATERGLDCDIHGGGSVDYERQVAIADRAAALDLARVSMDGDIVVERRQPLLRMGNAMVSPPPGAFLQATTAGENALSDMVAAHVRGCRAIADLFCGVGPFALRLAAKARILAADSDAAAAAALINAVNHTQKLKPVDAVVRDLFRDPLLVPELKDFDAVIFDPPRAGAKAQAEALSDCDVPIIVGVSCDPGTFARDAAILTAGGYVLERVTPVDQFRYAAHVEIVGLFRRP